MSIATLKCFRTFLTIILIYITFQPENLSTAIVQLGHVYLSLSSCIASFDATQQHPLKLVLLILPFVIASSALQHNSVFECIATFSFTLPFFQSMGILDVKTSTINLSITCIIVIVELLMFYSHNNVKFKNIKTVHISTSLVLLCSVASVTFPESCLMIAFNPIFQYMQGVGCWAIWETRSVPALLLPRQHAIGGYFTLSMAYIAMYWTMRISNLSGWGLLHIGPQFKKYVPATDLFLGFTHPFAISASVNGIAKKKSENTLMNFTVKTLNYLDSVTIPLLCAGPHCMKASWKILTGVTGVDEKWIKMLSIVFGISIVAITTKLHKSLVEIVWTKWKWGDKQYTENISHNIDNDNQILSEDCFQLTDIEEYNSGGSENEQDTANKT